MGSRLVETSECAILKISGYVMYSITEINFYDETLKIPSTILVESSTLKIAGKLEKRLSSSVVFMATSRDVASAHS